MKKLIGLSLAIVLVVFVIFNTEAQRGLGQSPNRSLPYAYQYSDAKAQIEAIRCVAYEIDALRKEIVELRKGLLIAVEPKLDKEVVKPKNSKYGPTYNPTVEEMKEWGMLYDDDLIGNGG